MMVGERDGMVVALYTNSRGFVTGYAEYGQTASGTEYGGLVAPFHPVVRLYRDSFLDDMVYAALIVSPCVRVRWTYNEDFFRATELQTFDVTNSLRVSRGLHPLLWDDLAAYTARRHSQYMATYDHFNHYTRDGTPPWARFAAQGGQYRALAENLAGRSILPLSMTFLDNWLNSQTGHREPIHSLEYSHLGVGMAYNRDSRYVHYIGQIFFRR